MTECIKTDSIDGIIYSKSELYELASKAERIGSLGRAAKLLWDQLNIELAETPLGASEGPCGYEQRSGIAAILGAIIDQANALEDKLMF